MSDLTYPIISCDPHMNQCLHFCVYFELGRPTQKSNEPNVICDLRFREEVPCDIATHIS